MEITSINFIFIFLPVFILVYWMVDARYRNIVLILGSLLFLGIGDALFLPLFTGLTIVNYLMYLINFKLRSKRAKKICLWVAVIIDLIPLLIFKYVPHMSLMPLGMSFYTFEMISWQIDVVKSKAQKRASFIEYFTFIAMFPKLLMGPLARIKDMRNSITLPRYFSLENCEEGLIHFSFGLGLKMLLAEPFSTLWSGIMTGGIHSLSLPMAWLGAFAYTLELYFDFWGYSEMAVGLGKILGFDLPANFKNPYLSTSMTEFFRRWHITLGAWFRDYVYIGLGGSREGTFRTIFNLFIVWLLTGVWHGDRANFLLWGFVLFVLITLEKFTPFKKITQNRFLGHMYILIIMPVLWMIFANSDFTDMLLYLGCMFGAGFKLEDFINPQFIRSLMTYWPFFVFGLLGITSLPGNILKRYKKSPIFLLALLGVFWWSVYQIWVGSSNPFLYLSF